MGGHQILGDYVMARKNAVKPTDLVLGVGLIHGRISIKPARSTRGPVFILPALARRYSNAVRSDLCLPNRLTRLSVIDCLDPLLCYSPQTSHHASAALAINHERDF